MGAGEKGRFVFREHRAKTFLVERQFSNWQTKDMILHQFFRVQMVRNIASSLGLEFRSRERSASTIRGHALLEYAKENAEEKQDSVAEKLFKVEFPLYIFLNVYTYVLT